MNAGAGEALEFSQTEIGVDAALGADALARLHKSIHVELRGQRGNRGGDLRMVGPASAARIVAAAPGRNGSSQCASASTRRTQ
jgi:hypothetical protein